MTINTNGRTCGNKPLGPALAGLPCKPTEPGHQQPVCSSAEFRRRLRPGGAVKDYHPHQTYTYLSGLLQAGQVVVVDLQLRQQSPYGRDQVFGIAGAQRSQVVPQSRAASIGTGGCRRTHDLEGQRAKTLVPDASLQHLELEFLSGNTHGRFPTEQGNAQII